MSKRVDLTRWNRAGLSQFQYLDDNAASYLDFLREQISASLAPWQPSPIEEGINENDKQRLERLLRQYNADRGDLGWEIARAFARCCHVLTKHLDAHANEGYLRTATQWENVRRLVAMLDYHPAPPASASTPLLVQAKDGQRGLLERGFQVKYTPLDGGPAMIFETLEDINVDSALNELHLAGWNRSIRLLAGAVWMAPEDADVTAGQYAVVVNGENAAVVSLAKVDDPEPESKSRKLTLDNVPVGWPRGSTALLAAPKKIRRPRLNGQGVMHFEEAHGVVSGEVLAWHEHGDWTFAAVAEADETGLLLDGRDPGTDLYKMIPVEPGVEGVALPLKLEVAAKEMTDGGIMRISVFKTVSDEGDPATERYNRPADMSGIIRVFYVPEAAESVGRLVPVSEYVFDGGPGDLESGQWVVADMDSGKQALRIKEVVEFEDRFVVQFAGSPIGSVKAMASRPVRDIQGVGARYEEILKEMGATTIGQLCNLQLPADAGVHLRELKAKAEHLLELEPSQPVDASRRKGAPTFKVTDWVAQAQSVLDEDAFHAITANDLTVQATGKPQRLKRLIGPFQAEIHPSAYDRNETQLSGSELLLAREVPDSFTRGKVILLEREKQTRDGFENACKAVIGSVDTDARTIVIDPGIKADAGFTIGNTVLRGNVVTAGHGENKPVKVLGSGNAAQSSQTFLLAVDNVSFIEDSTMPSGVRADIALTVGEQTWTQVATLNNSEPADPHYTVRLTEDSHLLIQTGDGKRGRRLPTGTNNVTVRYRVGNGLAGNIDAGSISKPLKPFHLIDSVRQVLAATGGNGLEGIESLRESAPATVLTLERAVSLRDYASLARAQSSVWQAAAFTRQPKRRGRSRVEVIVVPAGGGALGDLQQALTSTLQAHALPTVDIEVTPYISVAFHIDVTVRVKSAAFEPDEVVAAVRSALIDAFALGNRRLGQDLYASEVFRVVEAVAGVENSTCTINGDPALQRVPAGDCCVVFIDPDRSLLQVQWKEYQL